MRLCAAFLVAAVAASAQTAARKGPAPAAGANKLLNPAALNEKAPEQYRARFTTTKGQFVIRVVRNYAPLAADRFYNLVKNGFYDGTAFHRVHPGFVAQFGLHANPAVQARWEKAKLKDEKVVKSNLFGWVAFAADGTDGRNTQIYVSLKDNKSLDGEGFPPFGDIEKGIGVFATIYGGYGDKPNQQTIVRQGAAYLKRSFPQMDYVTKAAIE